MTDTSILETSSIHCRLVLSQFVLSLHFLDKPVSCVPSRLLLSAVVLELPPKKGLGFLQELCAEPRGRKAGRLVSSCR